MKPPISEFDAMLARVSIALDGRTRSFQDEIKLHGEMAAAFEASGIAFEREVPVRGGGYADFVLEGWCVVEVKARGGGGMSPVRQLLGYLRDGRFRAGIVVSVNKVKLPMAEFIKPDGSVAPLGKVELWRNAL